MFSGKVWPRVSVADVCQSIVDCVNKTAPVAEGPTPYKMIRTTNVREGWVDLSSVRCVDAATYEKWTRRQKPMRGDVILTREAPLGEVGLLRSDDEVFLGQRLVAYRADPRKLDNRFLLYAMLAEDVQGQIRSMGSGATVEHMRVPDCEKLTLRLPPIDEQRRIAGILSAYDDLIENNTRRIAILEEMARRLYEEWFVRFRFPGHEGVRMVESESGLVPERWNHLPLGMLIAHHIGGGWGQEAASKEFCAPAYVIRGTDIPDVRLGSLGRSPLRFHTASNFRSRRLEPRDIVFEVSGGSKDQPVGRAVMVGDALLSRADAPVVCASFCRLVRADASQILPELLRFHFDRIYASREIMQYQTQSTGITNFKFTVFLENEMVLKPQAEVQGQFSEVVRPMLRLSECLGIKNSVLRATRDLLLPKLISGELDVAEVPEPEALAA